VPLLLPRNGLRISPTVMFETYGPARRADTSLRIPSTCIQIELSVDESKQFSTKQKCQGGFAFTAKNCAGVRLSERRHPTA